MDADTFRPRTAAAGAEFHNHELAGHIRSAYTAAELSALATVLTRHATLDLIFVEDFSVRLPEGEQPLLLLPATLPRTHHGEMSSMVYLRDQIQAADAYLRLHAEDPARRARQGDIGRRLLWSALHLFSTPAQLRRFETCVARYAASDTCGQADWPQVALSYDNLDGERPNGWRNIQDALQMLGHLALVALERGQIDPGDLLPSHRQALGSIAPLLVAAGFPNYENSGSWEEVAARRTSVMGVETAFLAKLQELGFGPAGDDRYAFFGEVYRQHRRRAPGVLGADFSPLLSAKVHEGLTAISGRLPHESPDYDRHSVKYRTADLALVHLLRYRIPELLARHAVPIPALGGVRADEECVKRLVLTQLDSLRDPEGHGMYRYADDSYQRVNWGTEATRSIVAGIKTFVVEAAAVRGEPVDYELKQSLRHMLTPVGRQAAWSLGHAQLALWAAEQFLEHREGGRPDRAAQYLRSATAYLNATLALVTGTGQYTSGLSREGRYEVQPVVPWRIPECYVTYEVDDERCVVPSPHTPLFWATALTKSALGLLGAGLREPRRPEPLRRVPEDAAKADGAR